MTALSPELLYLVWSVALCVGLMLIAVLALLPKVGLPALAGNRDKMPVLEGFAGRECARLHDPAVVRRIGDALTRLKAAAVKSDFTATLEAKTAFYAALIGGCQNAFIERMLKPLHDRITLLRITSMSQPKRINKSLREVTAIWRAIQNGDPDLAERCCVDHVRAAAEAALSMIAQSAKEKADTDG